MPTRSRSSFATPLTIPEPEVAAVCKCGCKNPRCLPLRKVCTNARYRHPVASCYIKTQFRRIGNATFVACIVLRIDEVLHCNVRLF